MVADFDYIHSIPGRLRVKVPEVKRSPEAAMRVQRRLSELEAVREVRANPLTGNVLVLYEPGGTGPDRIIEAIRAPGYLRSPRPGPMVETSRPGGKLMDALAWVASKFLLEAIFGPVAGGVLGGLLVDVDLTGAWDGPAGRARRAGEAPSLGKPCAVA
jgi:hypothetical protein